MNGFEPPPVDGGKSALEVAMGIDKWRKLESVPPQADYTQVGLLDTLLCLAVTLLCGVTIAQVLR